MAQSHVVQIGKLRMPVIGAVDPVIESEVRKANDDLSKEAAKPGKNPVQESVVREMTRETSQRARA